MKKTTKRKTARRTKLGAKEWDSVLYVLQFYGILGGKYKRIVEKLGKELNR